MLLGLRLRKTNARMPISLVEFVYYSAEYTFFIIFSDESMPFKLRTSTATLAERFLAKNENVFQG